MKDLESQIRGQIRRLESILHQKARELWIAAGDRNTKYFHTNLLTKKRANRIFVIKENGS